MEHETLMLFWVAALAVAILVYGVLDGFDLGVGMLYGLEAEERARREMMATIAPAWDGNETWLILIGTILFGAFAPVYAVLLPAFYIPVLLMLLGLIFRGVAFEFRGHAGPRARRLWDLGFWAGSGVVAFVQGAALGTMIDGIPVVDGRYVGGSFIWLKSFPVLCGFGLMFGYAVLGAAWLLARAPSDAVRARAATWGRRAALGMVLLFGLATVLALRNRPDAWANLQARPWALVPAFGWAAAVGALLATLRPARSGLPFGLAALSFLGAFLVLAAAFWPFMVPGALTVAQAAAPEASLRFLFWGAGLVALPVIILYTIIVYRVFRWQPIADHAADYRGTSRPEPD